MNPHYVVEQMRKAFAAYEQRILALEARIKALEDKRGPGRPKAQE